MLDEHSLPSELAARGLTCLDTPHAGEKGYGFFIGKDATRAFITGKVIGDHDVCCGWWQGARRPFETEGARSP